MVIGLGQAGGGLSFTYGMFAEVVISQLGWRYAYLVLACTLVVFILPIYLIFYYRPGDKGLQAYGSTELSSTTSSALEKVTLTNSVSFEWTVGRAIRTYRFWLIVCSYFLYWGIGNYLVLAHQVKFTEDVGYSSVFSASILALFGVFMVVGQLSSFISDSIGREKAITIATISTIGALVALVLVSDTSRPWLLHIYAACFGYGAGLYTPTLVAAAADVFYGKHFGAIAGLLLTGLGVGGAIGPWLGGYIYDISGSYSSAFVFCMVCFGVSCIIFWIAAPRNTDKFME